MHRGFEHLEFATHGALGPTHYARWLATEHPEAVGGFYAVLDHALQVNAAGGGDSGAPQVHVNPIDKGWYHTDWVADRTIGWLDSLDADDDWFCWMSFPDPHHPWDPPQSEMGRVDWHDVDLPAGYPEHAADRERILDAKPRHWRLWYDGSLVSNYEAPAEWVPASLTADQVREVNARNAIECELIDEALGRVLAAIEARGWVDDVDIIFTTDHGELQGDFGLLFKGPYHVDGLMRLPLVWRPAPSATVAPAVVSSPVGLVDLAATFCGIAGLDVPEWVEGTALPLDRRGRGLEVGSRAHRVGQRAVRRGGAPAHHHPRRGGSAPPTCPAPSTTARRVSCTTWSTIRSSRSTCGTTRPGGPCATTCSTTSGRRRPCPTIRGCSSRRRCSAHDSSLVSDSSSTAAVAATVRPPCTRWKSMASSWHDTSAAASHDAALLLVERRQLRCELRLELAPQHVAGELHALEDDVVAGGRDASGARGGRERLVEAEPTGDEVADTVVERALAEVVDAQQGQDRLDVPLDGRADQVVGVGVVAVHRSQRHPRPAGDVLGARLEVVLGEQLHDRVEHRQAVAVAARGAAVDLDLVVGARRLGVVSPRPHLVAHGVPGGVRRMPDRTGRWDRYRGAPWPFATGTSAASMTRLTNGEVIARTSAP